MDFWWLHERCFKRATCTTRRNECGKCNDQNMIYQAKVTTPTSRETYIGLCDRTHKLRFWNHVCWFKNERFKHATELSKFIWNLKDKSISYNIKWWKVKQARSYSNVSKRCNLCLWESILLSVNFQILHIIWYKDKFEHNWNFALKISSSRNSKQTCCYFWRKR